MKKKPGLDELKAKTDAKVEVWRNHKDEVEQAWKEFASLRAQAHQSDARSTFSTKILPDQDRARLLAAELKLAEAEAKEGESAREASAALAALECAEEDELSLCHAPRLLATVEKDAERITTLESQLYWAKEGYRQHVEAAGQAYRELSARRAADRLPSPVAPPNLVPGMGAPIPAQDAVVIVRGAIDHAPDPRPAYSRRSMREIRQEERELLASIEQRHREAEERRKANNASDRIKAEQKKARDKENDARNAEAVLEAAERRAKEEELAAAARARLGFGGAQ